MAERLLRRELLGDMEALWMLSEDGRARLELNPAGRENRRREKRLSDSLVQLRLRGDAAPFGFANGHTMRNGASVERFRYEGQEVERDGERIRVVTRLASPEGLVLVHALTHYAGERGVEVRTAFENHSGESVTLEMLSSFSLSGLTPYVEGDAPGCLVLHRLRSKWSNEGRLVSERIEDLQLEPSWSGHGAASEKFGQVGSLPVRKWFPFAAVEDVVEGVCWGVQLHAPGSWQLEVYRRDDGLCLSGGLADFDFGHWAKEVSPGETFEAPVAHLSACAGDLDTICARLTGMQRRALEKLPGTERLPVVFNEFCTTWGCPSQEKLGRLLEVLAGRDIDYFVIDCGWYAREDGGWELNMGDWRVNESQFPEGLGAAARAIRAAGMKPGLWFEPETVGRDADAFTQREDHLLKRFGAPIQAGFRRFWDMRDPWVRAYLSDRVIAPLCECGFEYVKLDYNESFGAGCDGAESLGEGLRASLAASQDFFREIHARVPGIVVEGCASGGHRLEPSFLALCQLASATDAHEERELPVIAANLHRAMLPRQSLIWAVLRAEDTPRRLVWSLAATLLGVMCLSGDIDRLTEDQWAVVEAGIAFHRRASGIILDGDSRRHGPPIASYRHPAGWQAVERTSTDGRRKLVVAHAFDGAPEAIEIPIDGNWAVEGTFAEDANCASLAGNALRFALPANAAAAVLLRRITEEART